MNKKALRGITISLGLLVIGLGAMRYMQMKNFRGGTLDLTLADFGPVPAFSLTERSGKTIAVEDLHGKPWVGNFVFTRCAGPCPLLSMRMAEIQDDFLKNSNLQLVSFSVDPEYDTPAVLTEYAKRYDADPDRWYFLTGDSRRIFKLIVEGFHLAVEKNTDPNQKPGEQVNHSLSFVLVDADGRIRGYYAGNNLELLKKLRRDIKTLLKK